MRKISIISIASIMMLSLLFSSQLITAQTSTPDPGYQLILANGTLTSDKTFEFDLLILDTDPSNPFELALLQAGILVSPAFYANGTVTASIVEGSSQLIDEQKPMAIQFAQAAGIVKIPSRTLKPLPKEAKPERRGTIISAKAPGTRICRIKLTNTTAFTKAMPGLAFNFAKLPYQTTVSQYIDGMNTMLPCNEKTCVVKM